MKYKLTEKHYEVIYNIYYLITHREDFVNEINEICSIAEEGDIEDVAYFLQHFYFQCVTKPNEEYNIITICL